METGCKSYAKYSDEMKVMSDEQQRVPSLERDSESLKRFVTFSGLITRDSRFPTLRPRRRRCVWCG